MFCKLKEAMDIYVSRVSSDRGAGLTSVIYPQAPESPAKWSLDSLQVGHSGQLTKWLDFRCLGSTENMFI